MAREITVDKKDRVNVAACTKRCAIWLKGSTMLELILQHSGPLQPNKGSVANLRATPRTAGRQCDPDNKADNGVRAKPLQQAAKRRNDRSTPLKHQVKTRRILHQLLTGSL